MPIAEVANAVVASARSTNDVLRDAGRQLIPAASPLGVDDMRDRGNPRLAVGEHAEQDASGLKRSGFITPLDELIDRFLDDAHLHRRKIDVPALLNGASTNGW
jgi:hypothetical protein